MANDELSDFSKESHTYDNKTKDVYWIGSGPAVVVMTEMPGITPDVADFARRLVAEGFSVALPDLFGEPGRRPSGAYLTRSIGKGCVSKEFVAFATGRTSPVVAWMRGLVAEAHNRSGVGDGRGVGVVGMCFTGGFSLALAVDPLVTVPVMSQPSLPLAVGKKRKRDLGMSSHDLEVVRDRAAAGEICAVGLRFTEDPHVHAERFDSLRALLGDAFIGIEIDSSEGNEHGFGKGAHSVLTTEWRDEEGFPTKGAHDVVMTHLKQRLM